ncbi:MAG: cobalamin-dependent protein [Bacillota bacterium]
MDEVLIRAVEELDEKYVFKLIKERLQLGLNPLYIQEQIRIGMERVGSLYEVGEYFIADLIMAGTLFKDIMELEEMRPNIDDSAKEIGTIVLGTADGDLHDIGKNIFGSMMKAASFRVFDLGTDVSAEDFCDAVSKIKPDIIGISGVLTIALASMKALLLLIT